MTTVDQRYNQSKSAKIGWIILLVLSALLIFAGVGWFNMLPQMALENIAEYANLDPESFRQGVPSSFDVITIIARGYGVGYAAFGVMAFLVALEGFRRGRRWAWMVMWVLAAAYAALAGVFVLGGEAAALSLGFLSIAAAAVVGLLLASRGLTSDGR